MELTHGFVAVINIYATELLLQQQQLSDLVPLVFTAQLAHDHLLDIVQLLLKHIHLRVGVL